MSQEIKTTSNTSAQESQQEWRISGVPGDIVTRPVRRIGNVIVDLIGFLAEAFSRVLFVSLLAVLFSFLTYILLTDLEANHGEFKGWQHAFDRFGHQIGIQFEFEGGFIYTTPISTDQELNTIETSAEKTWTDTLSEGWNATYDYVVKGAVSTYDWLKGWFGADSADAAEMYPHHEEDEFYNPIDVYDFGEDSDSSVWKLHNCRNSWWKTLTTRRRIFAHDANVYVLEMHQGQVKALPQNVIISDVAGSTTMLASVDIMQNKGNRPLDIVDLIALHPYGMQGMEIRREEQANTYRVRVYLVAEIFYVPERCKGFSVVNGDSIVRDRNCIINRHLESIGWVEFFYDIWDR
ncbi:hypothetical protein IJJ08_02910 [bacterium]|nr:hypothetical protein [bacterium]